MSKVEKWIEVGAPVQQVFDLFSNFESMPHWMHGVTEVHRITDGRLRWLLTGRSSGIGVQWETELITFEPLRRLSWHGVGGDVDASGDIVFEETQRGTTLMQVQLGYDPRSGHSSGEKIARLFNEDLAKYLEEDLQLFKRIAEEHQTSEQSDVRQSPSEAVSAPTMLPLQSPAAQVIDQNKANSFAANQPTPPEEITLAAALQGDDKVRHQEVAGTKAFRSPLQHVEVYHDTSEAPYTQLEERQVSFAEETGERAVLPVSQHESRISQDDAPTIVAAARPAPSVNTDPSARTVVNHQAAAYTHRSRQPWLLYALLAAVVFGLSLLWYASSRESSTALNSSAASPPPQSAETNMPAPAPPASDAAVPTELPTEAAADSSTSALPGSNEATASSDTADAGEPRIATTEGRNNRAVLRAKLDEWIRVTNARDVDKQFSFYDSVVQRYYLTSYVSRERVRDDKSQLFLQADSVDISIGEPQITFDRRGTVATMRFRKRYDIERKKRSRRGEVLQELKWLKTDKEGWKIISERDLRVIR